jgi:hypothetical protein
MPALVLYEVIAIGRWGSTIGTSLFELQVAGVDGGKPGWKRALRRVLAMLGPLLAIGWIEMALDASDLTLLRNIVRIINATMFVTWIIHLSYVSLRVSGKRTAWDRFAGTIVRYRR